MDDRLRICLWMVGGGVFGSVLGAAFGALTGIVNERSGGSAGTHWARRVVESFLDSAVHPPSPTGRAALFGAMDGFFFLGILGLVGGALLGLSGRSADQMLVPMIVGSVLLVGGAIFFGTLAYALAYYGAECFYGGGGGILGCLLTSSLLGSEYGLLGIIPGVITGLVLCHTLRRYSPKFQPPCFDDTMLRPRADPHTDITGQQSSHPNDEFFREQDES